MDQCRFVFHLLVILESWIQICDCNTVKMNLSILLHLKDLIIFFFFIWSIIKIMLSLICEIFCIIGFQKVRIYNLYFSSWLQIYIFSSIHLDIKCRCQTLKVERCLVISVGWLHYVNLIPSFWRIVPFYILQSFTCKL